MATTLLAGFSHTACAQSQQVTYMFDLPAGDLDRSLRAVGRLTKQDVLFQPDAVSGAMAPALHGTYTLADALNHLLAGSNLEARFDGGAVVIQGRLPPPLAKGPPVPPSDIVVTGSRIVGAQATAVVTTVTAEDMRNAGQNDLGEMARSLPQNFGGGQNPGIGNTQGANNANTNVNSASTFNLRGIGPAATLTLLNGNRLSYSGVSGAVDISIIPVAAVDRVEVVTDGASAIYGADAVAGVANIILKRDYQGLVTSARLGGSTDGGNFEQQYDLVGGTKWSSGGFIATYDYLRNTPITAGERSYTSTSNPASYLYPDISRHSALLSLHQAVTDDITFQSDVVYKTGRMDSLTAYLLGQPATYQGFTARTQFSSIGFAPNLEFKLGGSWTAKVSGFLGRDTTTGVTNLYYFGLPYSNSLRHYVYDTQSAEANLQGALFSLPAGDLRLAVGGGVRSYKLTALTDSVNLAQRLTNYFGYVEASAPIVSPEQNVPLIHRATLTAAMRFEGYSGSDQVSTPKISFIYEPVEMLRLSASWGRSYKLPTIYQRFSGYASVLLPVSGYGSTYPANATFVELLGANTAQRAEHSENWDVGALLTPLPGLTLSSDYFHIDYRDRVATPITSSVGVLTNPIYSSFVTMNPSAALLTQLNNGALGGLQNGTTGAYNAANVVAIIDMRDVNVARQIYEGVDLSAKYRLSMARHRALDLSASSTWPYSRQQLLAGLPWTSLAGTIFNPPHFKARAGVTYGGKEFSVSSYVNYTGGITDNRLTTLTRVSGMTTIDLTGRISLGSIAEVALNAINLLNAKPMQIYTTSPYDTPFDTTNFSATGRFIGVTLSRAW